MSAGTPAGRHSHIQLLFIIYRSFGLFSCKINLPNEATVIITPITSFLCQQTSVFVISCILYVHYFAFGFVETGRLHHLCYLSSYICELLLHCSQTRKVLLTQWTTNNTIIIVQNQKWGHILLARTGALYVRRQIYKNTRKLLLFHSAELHCCSELLLHNQCN